MAVCSSRCIGFKKSHKCACKNCRNSRRGQRGQYLGKLFKKAKRFIKKVINSDLGKLEINEGLANAPKLYDMGTSRITNKKIRKIL